MIVVTTYRDLSYKKRRTGGQEVPHANTVGQPRQNASGTLFEGIRVWADHKAAGLVDHDRVYANALAAVRSEVAHGVGHIRTHVDTTESGLIALDAILQLKADVAFSSGGRSGTSGTRHTPRRTEHPRAG